MPRPTSFVEKNGSKIFSMTSGLHAGAGVGDLDHHVVAGGDPVLAEGAQPPSAPTLAVRMVSVPPSGMASRAFTARLMTTCSN